MRWYTGVSGKSRNSKEKTWSSEVRRHCKRVAMPDLDPAVQDALQGILDDLIGQLEALGITSEPLRFEGERRTRPRS